MQAVLSAASQRNQSGGQRSTRGGAAEKAKAAPAAFIPVPDSTGVVDNYEELGPQRRWTDPVTYIRCSETIEETCANALNNGFTYFMDERDKDWLDKNNEEARGEGTSAQGAVSAAGTSTRSGNPSSRSAKAKGKEPEVVQAITMSEDEFELVMGLFEMVTHEKTEYLHHVGAPCSSIVFINAYDYEQSLETGMAFPAFTDYQDVFSSPLSASSFAAFNVPTWIPPPAQLSRIARVVYPYWKERRIERGGHRIIPTLNVRNTADLWLPGPDYPDRREMKPIPSTSRTYASGAAKSRQSVRQGRRRLPLPTNSFDSNPSWLFHWS